MDFKLEKRKYIFVAPGNLDMLPYVRIYDDKFSRTKNVLNVICWNRYPYTISHSHMLSGKVVTFEKPCLSTDNILYKCYKYFLFIAFVFKNIPKRDESVLIVNTLQLALFIYPIFFLKSNLEFILDIRDYPKYFSVFKYLYKRIIMNSSQILISSNGFRDWLPDREYIYVPNISIYSLSMLNAGFVSFSEFHYPLRILVIGQIRCLDSQEKLIKSLSNKRDFILQFYGVGAVYSILLQKYKGIDNVYFGGAYEKATEDDIVKGADFVSLISDHSYLEQTLESNRLLLAVLVGRPLIVLDGSHQSNIIKTYDLGVVISNVEEIEDKIAEFLRRGGVHKFVEGRNKYLSFLRESVNIFYKTVL